MKAIVAILVLAAVASATTLESFRAWSKTNNKLYTNREEARRFAIFKENSAKAERFNLESNHATFAANKFADLTNEEFASIYTSGLRTNARSVRHVVGRAETNANKDYRYMLPAVKDQASCGSCWAFSAVANMEAVTYQANGGEVVSLSEQQLVSCDKQNSACNGGSMTTADYYAVKHGMTSEELMPYTSATGSVAKCPSKLPAIVAEFSDYKHLTSFGTLSDSQLLKDLDAYGPLSIGIAADSSYFQLYSSGVLDDPDQCNTALDHGVTLVGYGTEDGLDYWLVRNSWGASWGDEGYVKLVRGQDMCFINEDISTIIA